MPKSSVIEKRTIDSVPESERHGKVSNQFTLWMAANLQITAIVDGALAVAFGTEALSAIIALFIGNILGGIIMALHSAQGPHLGLPQMISSRAQFGVKGAGLPLLLAVLMYIGFAASGIVLSGQAINLMIGVERPSIGILIFGCLTALIAIIGYKLIHLIGRIATIISILGFIYLTWCLCVNYNLMDAFGKQPVSITSFLFAMALSAGWQMTFAPYVADYSRYLPSSTSAKSTFWMTFLGTVIGAQIAMTFGVILAALVGNDFKAHQVVFLGALAGPAFAAFFVYFIIVLGKMTIACLNVYGGCMSILTIVSAYRKNQYISPLLRIAVVVIFIAICIVIALWGSADFLNKFKNFILLLLTMFVPWSAVNLVDYYLLSKEKVDIPALYDEKGRYGAYSITALVSYFIGILIQIPFLNMSFYQGALAKLMNGADISWIVSLIVTSIIFYIWGKRRLKI